MFVGIIHSIIPYFFPFSTSSFIIRSFKKLVESHRHRDELQQILDFEFIRQLDEELLAKKKKRLNHLHPDVAELARLNNARKKLNE